ncbi:unnamed protein product [Ascophyllum nodosum]
MTEDTRGKVTAGVANPGAGAGAGYPSRSLRDVPDEVMS